MNADVLFSLSIALGIGLLVGAERERRKSQSPQRSAAGIRSFAVASLSGAVAMLLSGAPLLALVVVITAVAALLAYRSTHQEDPGLTTELALVLTAMLGGLAVREAALAAGLGVVLAALLAARSSMHHFVKNLLSEQDLRDALIFAAVALILLPLAPNRFMGPWDALNPQQLVQIMLVVMLLSAAGYGATRWLGPQHGLPLAGFASGFVSGTATIHAMGQRAKAEPAVAGPCVAAAALSSIATIVQLSLLIALVHLPLLQRLAPALALGGLAALLYALWILRQGGAKAAPTEAATGAIRGRAFSLPAAAAFAGVLGLVMLAAAALNARLGEQGLILGAAISGLADAHAATASAASLLAAGKISALQAALPILVGLSANMLTKTVVAYQAGGWVYAQRVVPGLLWITACVWLGYAIGPR